MNILILSPGRRVEIVEYFKETFHAVGGKVFTLDMSPYAPALYSGDEFFRIDKDFNHLEYYIDNVLEICKQKEVSAILTLIDPELVLLSDYKDIFEALGIKVILSDIDFVKQTFDKYGFYCAYKDIINLVETVGSYEEAKKKLKDGTWKYPLFAKLRDGSASIGIKKIYSSIDFDGIKENPKYIYQPFIDGAEYGIDAYFDLITGELVSVFMKKKIAMRAGETDKAISVKSQTVLNEVKQITKIKGLYGPIDIDVFVSNTGEVYINEINPRFGGGHPHAYGCGINFMKLILNNLEGKVNTPIFDNYEEGIMMLKYNGLMFRSVNE
ncbi:carbamoyl-phosphate synthase large subunit [Prevotella communis]|uniref:Carbamoyl-phosphate synthase large subunit n=1 Tax=Prevotella communis TaxID=2913614 RepID=A0A1G8ASR9_9BACT|nr:ATP-grasp domain-containing protein [Prevotella communis]SDH24071.1 carbamoyl-phosphate synthase large subunit [Prevotella communis]